MLLDTFTILFDSDLRKLDDGLQKSEKGADDLLDGLKQVDKQAGATGSSFAGLAAKALGALTAVLSTTSVISGSIQKAADVAAIGQTAEALGVAVEELDAFGRSAQAMGGDAQGARDSVTDMAESIGEALQDVESGRAKTFDALGVSLRGVDGQAINAVEGILRLSDAVQGLSREEAVFRIKELGITDNRTVEMVLKGRKELERMLQVQKDSGVITKEQALQAQKFTESMNRLRGSLDTAGTGFMSILIPALEKGVAWLTKIVDWANENKHFIVGFFVAVAGIVTAVYLPAMISAAAATLAATWPLIAMGAAVAAVAALFALAYDDIMNFVEGNDSFIGQIFEKYPIVKDIVFAIIDAFKFMGQAVGSVFDMLIAGFKGVIDFVMTGVRQISSGIASVAGFFGIGGGKSGAAEGQQQLAVASTSPLNSTTSSSISNSVASTNRETNVQVGEVVVNTQATDANGISRDVNNSLSNQLAQLDSEFSSGVAR
ncbi:tape measure protein [Pseudomonas phage vB_PcuM_ KLEP17-4]|nr:tape measure protein [Pseudomonas phage vB_PcuM_ KLEP17-4]